MFKIDIIAAARPNFMKIAPLYHELQKHKCFQTKIIYTGQHYDHNMSTAFFNDLNLPQPDVSLSIGSGSHAYQTGHVMIAYEKYLFDNKPDLIIVVGDVNSTIACTLAAKKLNLQVAHLEAGLRSCDRTMPEEINRILTDVIVDILWTPSPDANENLLSEGIDQSKITMVGNIMIDSFYLQKDKINALQFWNNFNLKPLSYGLVTIHRPSNTDDPKILNALVNQLINIANLQPLIFPLHPRTRKSLLTHKLLSKIENHPNFTICEPLGYLEFMSLVTKCRFIITDSGGIQEETTFLNIPCLTLRTNTERPITCTQGSNKLVTIENLENNLEKIILNQWQQATPIQLWDGKTSQRIAANIIKRFKTQIETQSRFDNTIKRKN